MANDLMNDFDDQLDRSFFVGLFDHGEYIAKLVLSRNVDVSLFLLMIFKLIKSFLI